MANNTVYEGVPLEDHMRTIAKTDPPAIPSKPSFGVESWVGLAASFAAAPLYLYASLKGKLAVWDELLDDVPEWCLREPTLDVGSAKGMVLLKVAERKKRLALKESTEKLSVSKAYGIDSFKAGVQRSYTPADTYQNAGALDVVDFAVLNTASFTERLPFATGTFGLVTSNLVLHYASKDERVTAISEMARVCMPQGKIVIVDFSGHFGGYETALKALGWDEVKVSMVGFRMSYGVIPCQVLVATKPSSKV